jgi:hypothetical protein
MPQASCHVLSRAVACCHVLTVTHVVEHSILNGIEYCTFRFRSALEMTRHQLLLHLFSMLTIFSVAHPDQTALTL